MAGEYFFCSDGYEEKKEKKKENKEKKVKTPACEDREGEKRMGKEEMEQNRRRAITKSLKRRRGIAEEFEEEMKRFLLLKTL